MTSQYIFVAPERQNDLTRRIQHKLADTGKKPEERQAAPEISPPTPETPASAPAVPHRVSGLMRVRPSTWKNLR
jgi:hypothetical protein